MLPPAELFSLVGKSAVVTGAAGLLGRSHVAALAAAGATVFATDRDGEACARAVGTLRDRPGARGSVHALTADITVPESLESLAEQVYRATGRLDVLVNNGALDDKFDAGSDAARLSRFENYPLDRFRKILDVNVTGTFLPSQILGRRMLEQRAGSIINIASTYGMVGPDQRIYRAADPGGDQTFWKSPVYPASKGAVLAFTRFLATTWADRGVRVNSLSPGGMAEREPGHGTGDLGGVGDDVAVDQGTLGAELANEPARLQKRFFVAEYSRRTPLGRMGRPDELAGALIFLASDASSYVTGANLVVDGGWTAW